MIKTHEMSFFLFILPPVTNLSNISIKKKYLSNAELVLLAVTDCFSEIVSLRLKCRPSSSSSVDHFFKLL